MSECATEGVRSNNDNAASSSITLLYRHDDLSDAQMSNIARRRKHLGGLSGHASVARGLCSRIYRLNQDQDDEEEEGDSSAKLCVKRVMEDDQAVPHSVEREVLCYKLIWDAVKREAEQASRAHILPLLCAFHDASDEFDVMTDLIMPYHPCTLADLLDEPSLRLKQTHVTLAAEEQSRPALCVAQSIASVRSFVCMTVTSLFSALHFLHAHGIAHRDVKPSNILIRSSDLRIQLIDFGTCQLPLAVYAAGDDRRGSVASEVGTGAYRAPECLLSPRNGYEATKVDVWQAGVTLVELFMPLHEVKKAQQKMQQRRQRETVPKLGDRMGDDKDQLEWERALWSQDEGQSWSALRERFDEIDGHAPSFYNNELDPGVDFNSDEDDDLEESLGGAPSVTGWRREQLFDGTGGDLALANSIFTLCGLPKADVQGEREWPEAVYFQPPLCALPFARRLPAEGGFAARLDKDVQSIIAARIAHPHENDEGDERLCNIIDVLSQCIRLSAGQRISAEQALAQLGGKCYER